MRWKGTTRSVLGMPQVEGHSITFLIVIPLLCSSSGLMSWQICEVMLKEGAPSLLLVQRSIVNSPSSSSESWITDVSGHQVSAYSQKSLTGLCQPEHQPPLACCWGRISQGKWPRLRMSHYSPQGPWPEWFQGHEVMDVSGSTGLCSAAGLGLPQVGGWGWRGGGGNGGLGHLLPIL